MTEAPLSHPLALALQGGGAHGAFTWGVLDHLLAAGLRPAGLSGTSAGALNAAALASGWARAGQEGARATLTTLWEGVSALGGPLQPSPASYLVHGWNQDWSVRYQAFKATTQVASPYQFNPAGFNPLRELLQDCLDWSALTGPDAPPLFVSATEVETGRLRIFDNHSLDVTALLASTCLPTLFQAVERNGRHYWDGGFAANPALHPLLTHASADDLLLLQLMPQRTADGPPREPGEILRRSRELSFSTHLYRELQWLALQQADCGPGSRWSLSPLRRRIARLRFHHLTGDRDLAGLGTASQLNADWPFLCHLRDAGRKAADDWLATHGGQVGRTSSRPLSDFLPTD
ncbi:patatin-like phospholipase family protein [Alkalilimnicola ehrlichii MLHE-1]|uniref:Patatin n=1 Tax=Alkalilimnicola ehrlichii (strain ATCC BAA-1101 / DSM 17681 / MLHE-1) TaxID=187272 RepID=Q0A5Q6_ALKEH|nr:patatin-like phospholipase family protein [Alkalilimnicola ehrlichii]ABI57831.1 Patatin [Alkalilimnicola ehrlichii MLHE-1]